MKSEWCGSGWEWGVSGVGVKSVVGVGGSAALVTARMLRMPEFGWLVGSRSGD